jgi:hypothetical protein
MAPLSPEYSVLSPSNLSANPAAIPANPNPPPPGLKEKVLLNPAENAEFNP